MKRKNYKKGLALADIKTKLQFYKVSIIKIVVLVHRQAVWTIHINTVYDKGGISQITGAKMGILTNDEGTMNGHLEKDKIGSISYTIHKNKLQMHQSSNYKKWNYTSSRGKYA